MGSYTDRLYRKSRVKSVIHDRIRSETQPTVKPQERLVACYIKRDGVIHSFGCQSHMEIRRRLGDDSPHKPRLGDESGFVTSEGRHLRRWEAQVVGSEAGQCSRMERMLLSSDINW